MYASGAGSSSEGRPYQGYPYINPVVNDVSATDAANAARWAALAKRPATDRAGSSGERSYQGYPYVNPVMNDVGTIDAATAARWAALPRRPAPATVYEQPGGSRQDMPRVPAKNPQEVQTPRQQNTQGPPTEVKIDYDANPVVYIDLPQSSGSEVAEQRRPTEEESFVQQTIFYDQFKDRTVVTMSDETQSIESSSSESSHSYPRQNRPTRPAPPVTLSLGSPDSGHPSSSNRSTPGAPPIMSKEASLYRTYPIAHDTFTTLPEVREFPNPPPAYSQYDTLSPTAETPSAITRQPTPARTPYTPSNSPQPPCPESPLALNPANLPKTQVIVPTVDNESKIVYCKYCGVNSQSIMIKQVGFATHILALVLFLFGLLPCILMLYCSKSCRYKNHYCKQCNQLMAYEIPFVNKDVTYV